MAKIRTEQQLLKIDELLNKSFNDLTELEYDIFIKDILEKYKTYITSRYNAYKRRDPAVVEKYKAKQRLKRKNEKVISVR